MTTPYTTPYTTTGQFTEIDFTLGGACTAEKALLVPVLVQHTKEDIAFTCAACSNPM